MNKDIYNTCFKCLLVIIVIAVVIFLLTKIIPTKKVEKYSNVDYDTDEQEYVSDEVENMTNPEVLNDTKLMEERASMCYPKEQLTPDELLPQDTSSTWAQVNPEGQGSLKDKNFLQSGYHIGINTVGQTLRNANRQIRSEPPNPQVQVSPWLQSTIEPDVNRKPFEIGGCA